MAVPYVGWVGVRPWLRALPMLPIHKLLLPEPNQILQLLLLRRQYDLHFTAAARIDISHDRLDDLC